MRITGNDLAYHNGGDLLKGMDNFFQLKTKHGQPVGQFLGCSLIGNKFS